MNYIAACKHFDCQALRGSVVETKADLHGFDRAGMIP